MQLLFIHGSGGTARNWKYQSAHFKDSIAIDLPGRPDGEHCPTIGDAAGWLKADLDGRGASDLVLVGHSLGGGIALQYALDHPGDLRAIVLIGSGGRLRVHPDTLAFLEQAVVSPDGYTQMFADSWTKIDPDFRAELVAQAERLGPAVFLDDLKACDEFDVMERLGEIAIPVLAIVGTEDVMTPPKYSLYLADNMQHASVHIVEGGTHFVFAEYPDQVNEAIETFLAGLT